MQWIYWLGGAYSVVASLTPILNVIPFFNGQWLANLFSFLK